MLAQNVINILMTRSPQSNRLGIRVQTSPGQGLRQIKKPRSTFAEPQPIFIINAMWTPSIQQPITFDDSAAKKCGRLADNTLLLKAIPRPGFGRIFFDNLIEIVDMIRVTV